MLFTGVGCILVRVIDAFIVYKNTKIILRDIPYNGFILVAFATIIYLRRMYTLRSARRLIAHDMAAYDDEWERILADPTHANAFESIRVLAAKVTRNGVLRQCNRADTNQNRRKGSFLVRLSQSSESRQSSNAEEYGRVESGDVIEAHVKEGLPGVVCVYVCVCVCICMYVHMYVCMYVCAYLCMFTCMKDSLEMNEGLPGVARVYVGVYVCIYVHIYVCLHV